jgi:hypothetical protein
MGRTAFVQFGASMQSATGLKGSVRSFAPPHTGPNYLLREMVFVVGRRRAGQLRLLAVAFGFAVPGLLLLVPLPGMAVVAAAVHLGGVLCRAGCSWRRRSTSWGLYYGAR